MTMQQDPLRALERAAAEALTYRRSVTDPGTSGTRTYATLLATFEQPTPENGQDAREVIDDLVTLAGPGLRNVTGPRFFGWVIGASHPVGVAADWLTSAWGQNAGNHVAARRRRRRKPWRRVGFSI